MDSKIDIIQLAQFVQQCETGRADVATIVVLADVAVALHELYDDGLTDELPRQLVFDDCRINRLFDALAQQLPHEDAARVAEVVDALYRLLWAAAPAVGRPDTAREEFCFRETWALLDLWISSEEPSELFSARLALCLTALLAPDATWDDQAHGVLRQLLDTWAAELPANGTWQNVPHDVAALRAEAFRRNATWLLDDRYAAQSARLATRYPEPETASVVGLAKCLTTQIRTAAEACLSV